MASRVRQGGHDVPADKLAARWQRSVSNLGWYARQADVFFVFDNSDSTPDVPPVLIAEGGCGELSIFDSDAIPEITGSLRAAFTGQA